MIKVIKSLSDYNNLINEESEIYSITITLRNSYHALSTYHYHFPSSYYSIKRLDDLVEIYFLYVLERKDLLKKSKSVRAKDT